MNTSIFSVAKMPALDMYNSMCVLYDPEPSVLVYAFLCDKGILSLALALGSPALISTFVLISINDQRIVTSTSKSLM